MTADIVVSALECARARGYVAKGAIFHSDRGSQYTSRLLAGWADQNEVRLSVGRTGSCHDNAVAESFFANLKNEMYHRQKVLCASGGKEGFGELHRNLLQQASPAFHHRLSDSGASHAIFYATLR